MLFNLVKVNKFAVKQCRWEYERKVSVFHASKNTRKTLKEKIKNKIKENTHTHTSPMPTVFGVLLKMKIYFEEQHFANIWNNLNIQLLLPNEKERKREREKDKLFQKVTRVTIIGAGDGISYKTENMYINWRWNIKTS